MLALALCRAGLKYHHKQRDALKMQSEDLKAAFVY